MQARQVSRSSKATGSIIGGLGDAGRVCTDLKSPKKSQNLPPVTIMGAAPRHHLVAVSILLFMCVGDRAKVAERACFSDVRALPRHRNWRHTSL